VHWKTVFTASSHGQGMIEYALIVVLVAIVVVGGLIFLGPTIGQIFQNVSPAL
jgi:pilus assembly protein Flp/PilA